MRIQQITGVRLYFLPVQTRVPLKFGPETLSSVTCARVALRVRDQSGREVEGWGETPLSVQWVWPSSLPYEPRHNALKEFCGRLAGEWARFECAGHALEVGHAFQEQVLGRALREFTGMLGEGTSLAPTPLPIAKGNPSGAALTPPWLAALVCNSPFDIALHDAFGKLAGRPVYETYGSDFLQRDLASFIEPAADSRILFKAQFPSHYLVTSPPRRLRAWHLVGGLDPLTPAECTGAKPNDGYPVALTDWIARDGLKCLKVKLRGNDADWDYQRLVRVGEIAQAQHVESLTADFNCTVQDPAYVNEILDRLKSEHCSIWDCILYIEQPFAYELEKQRLDVHSVSKRKPLFLDESAHDWRAVRLGRELGWTGVALKTCKTQTGAILSACWSKAHGMSLMVQDLTNPMLAQIPHVLLAAHFGTIMGVETNAMQFYPAASAPEQKIHPGLYQRRRGEIELSSIYGPGFGYRLDEMQRVLPSPAVAF